jgi:hypothetical protein
MPPVFACMFPVAMLATHRSTCSHTWARGQPIPHVHVARCLCYVRVARFAIRMGMTSTCYARRSPDRLAQVFDWGLRVCHSAGRFHACTNEYNASHSHVTILLAHPSHGYGRVIHGHGWFVYASGLRPCCAKWLSPHGSAVVMRCYPRECYLSRCIATTWCCLSH